MPIRKAILVLGLVILLVAGGLSTVLWLGGDNMAGNDQIMVVNKGSRPNENASSAPPVGGPFNLINGDGKLVSNEDFAGQNMLIFFGFTHCPDVCPQTLSTLTRALELIGDDIDKVQPVFVTVDPLRDTPDVVKAYVADFHPKLIGLTGTSRQVSAAMRAYRIYAAKMGDELHIKSDYQVDHTSITYLMGPDGAFKTFFSLGDSPDSIATKLRLNL
jgi:protein SCO1/2